MKTSKQPQAFATGSNRHDLRASSGVVNAVKSIVGTIEGVSEIRVLHRDGAVSKFFVMMSSASLSTIERVVDAMVQLEETFAGDRFDYDTVPAGSAHFVPPAAVPIGHG